MSVYQVEDAQVSTLNNSPAPSYTKGRPPWRNHEATRDVGCSNTQASKPGTAGVVLQLPPANSASLQLVHPCKFTTREFADLMMHTVPSLILSGFRERAVGITKQDDADPWGKQSCVHPHPRSYRYTANLIASGLAHGSRQRGKGMKSLST